MEQLFRKSLYNIKVTNNIKYFSITVVRFLKNRFYFILGKIKKREKTVPIYPATTTVNIIEYIIPIFFQM